jgi:hypothetical protein
MNIIECIARTKQIPKPSPPSALLGRPGLRGLNEKPLAFIVLHRVPTEHVPQNGDRDGGGSTVQHSLNDPMPWLRLRIREPKALRLQIDHTESHNMPQTSEPSGCGRYR